MAITPIPGGINRYITNRERLSSFSSFDSYMGENPATPFTNWLRRQRERTVADDTYTTGKYDTLSGKYANAKKEPEITVPEVQGSGFKGTTHVTLVLDRSGSMLKVKQRAIDGVNLWLKSLQKAAKTSGGAFPVTIVLFNTDVETPVEGVPAAAVNPLDETRYICRGNTALNDAIVEAVFSTADRVQEGDRALVCIVTDGKENSSKEYTTDQTRSVIGEKESEGTWTFTYLSASPNAFAEARSYGVRQGNTASYDGDAAGTTQAFNRVSHATHSYAMGAQASEERFYAGDIPVVVDESVPPGEIRMVYPTAPLSGMTAWGPSIRYDSPPISRESMDSINEALERMRGELEQEKKLFRGRDRYYGEGVSAPLAAVSADREDTPPEGGG